MYTKSLIQQKIEILHLRENFNDTLTELLEKYNIHDNIFMVNQGECMEVTRGYFVLLEEYQDLSEAIKNCDVFNQGIRIINNSTFQVGNIYSNLNSCPKDTSIYNIG